MFRKIILAITFSVLVFFQNDQASAQSLILSKLISCPDSDDINEILKSYYIQMNSAFITDIIVKAKIKSEKCAAIDLDETQSKTEHVHWVISSRKLFKSGKIIATEYFTIYESEEEYILKIVDISPMFHSVIGPEI